MASERKTASKQSRRREAFIQEYLVDLNGAKAAIRAGYSRMAAKEQAHRLLTNAHIRQKIATAMEKRTVSINFTANELLARLLEEGNADLADLFDENNGVKPVREWPPVWRRGLVSSLRVEMLYEGKGDSRVCIGKQVTLKLADRARRLELIGRHVQVGAFKDRVEVDASEPLKQLYEQICGKSITPKVARDVAAEVCGR